MARVCARCSCFSDSASQVDTCCPGSILLNDALYVAVSFVSAKAPPSNPPGPDVDLGLVLGLVFGGLSLIAAVVILVCLCLRRRRHYKHLQ